MAPFPGTCVACNELFALNGELASVPDGSTVAFDPAHRRVWRICGACGEWNLLGQEAAAAALPELEARFAAALKTPGDAGFAPAHVGRTLDLLRVGGTAVQDQDDMAALRRRNTIVRTARFGLIGLGLAGAGLLGDTVFITRHHAWTTIITCYLLAAPTTFLESRIIRIRHHLPVTRRSILASIALLVAGAALPLWTDPHPQYILIGFAPVLAITLIGSFLLPPIPMVSLRLSYGYNVRFFTRESLAAVTMSWSSGGEIISLHDLPGGRAVHGDDAEVLLRRLLRMGLGMRTVLRAPSATSQAYDLLRSAGGLRGLLHALDGFRRDSDGRLVIAQLPKVYLLALDLALASPDDSKGPDFRLRRKAAEAALIAGEAEALDRDLSH